MMRKFIDIIAEGLTPSVLTPLQSLEAVVTVWEVIEPYDDDWHGTELAFDAIAWFKQASAEDIEELVCSNEHIAERVAHFCAQSNGELAQLLSIARMWTCEIDHQALMAAIRKYRPDILQEGLAPSILSPRKIFAEVHSDDHREVCEFNAAPWFVQASDEEIQALIDCDFASDYPADYVAEYMAEYDGDVKRVFDYIRNYNSDGAEYRREMMGFEVEVAIPDAMQWIRYSRPLMVAANPDLFEGGITQKAMMEALIDFGNEPVKAYYHVTLTRDLKKIMKNGLQPRVGPRSKRMSEQHPRIYLFRNRAQAEDAVMNWMGAELPEDEPLSLLKVLIPDEDSLHDNPSQMEATYYEDIPPEGITVVTKDF